METLSRSTSTTSITILGIMKKVTKYFSNNKDFLPNTPPEKDSDPNEDFIFDGEGNILAKALDHGSEFVSVAALQVQ